MKRPNTKRRRRLESGVLRHVHHMLLGMMLAFVIAAIILGEMLDAYDAFWWWDDMLHGLSGVLFGLIGWAALYAMNRRKEISLSPLAIAIFVMCFSLAMGVAWEIYEFVLDVNFKTTMQQWNMGPNAIVMGREYQGMGLRDTMSDLTLATIGAFITSGFVYMACRWNRQLVRRAMRWSFPLKVSK